MHLARNGVRTHNVSCKSNCHTSKTTMAPTNCVRFRNKNVNEYHINLDWLNTEIKYSTHWNLVSTKRIKRVCCSMPLTFNKDLYSKMSRKAKWVSDCCLALSEQCFNIPWEEEVIFLCWWLFYTRSTFTVLALYTDNCTHTHRLRANLITRSYWAWVLGGEEANIYFYRLWFHPTGDRNNELQHPCRACLLLQ